MESERMVQRTIKLDGKLIEARTRQENSDKEIRHRFEW